MATVGETVETGKLKIIASALWDMGIVGEEPTIEYPGTINGGHDETWFVAGFANGGLGVDLYLDANLSEYINSVDTDLKIDDDPRVLAALIKGAYHAHVY